MMENKNKVFFWTFIILSILFFILGYFAHSIGMNYINKHIIYLSLASCHDGCSFATKNKTTGFINNKTWDCWKDCDNYFKDIIKEFANEK